MNRILLPKRKFFNKKDNSVIFCWFLFLSSCFFSPDIKKDFDINSLIKQHSTYDVLNYSKTRYGGRTCEQGSRDHSCFEDCHEMYTNIKHRDKCKTFPITQIERLSNLHKFFENPNREELDRFDYEDFKVYLSISGEAINKVIKRYRESDAKEFILWLIRNRDAYNFFEKYDENYKNLEILLDRIEKFNPDSSYKPFLSRIEGSDKLMELAIAKENSDVVEWFMDYINEGPCRDEAISQACLNIYCKIGDKIDSHSRKDWLEHSSFENYIEEIIDQGINQVDTNKWWDKTSGQKREIEEIGDLRNENWLILCNEACPANVCTEDLSKRDLTK